MRGRGSWIFTVSISVHYYYVTCFLKHPSYCWRGLFICKIPGRVTKASLISRKLSFKVNLGGEIGLWTTSWFKKEIVLYQYSFDPYLESVTYTSGGSGTQDEVRIKRRYCHSHVGLFSAINLGCKHEDQLTGAISG